MIWRGLQRLYINTAFGALRLVLFTYYQMVAFTTRHCMKWLHYSPLFIKMVAIEQINQRPKFSTFSQLSCVLHLHYLACTSLTHNLLLFGQDCYLASNWERTLGAKIPQNCHTFIRYSLHYDSVYNFSVCPSWKLEILICASIYAECFFPS